MRTGLNIPAWAIIGVRTSSMLMVVNEMPWSANSMEAHRVQALSVALVSPQIVDRRQVINVANLAFDLLDLVYASLSDS